MHIHVGQVTQLHCNVVRTDFPSILELKQSVVGARGVGRCLSGWVSKRPVTYEGHGLSRMIGQLPSVAHRAHLITELLVFLPCNFRNGEITGVETGKLEVSPAIITIISRILGRIHRVEDTHTDVTYGNGTIFTFFQFQPAGSRHQDIPVFIRIR